VIGLAAYSGWVKLLFAAPLIWRADFVGMNGFEKN
jgi:hypothetical protein